MRLIRRALSPVIALALVVLGGAAVSAATSLSGTAAAKFSVPVTVSIAAGSGGSCGPNFVADFGNPVLGQVTPTVTCDMQLAANDPNGFSLSIVGPGGQIAESGCAGANPSKTTGYDDILYQAEGVTQMNSGSAGTPLVSGFNGGFNRIAAVNTDMYSADPTAIGDTMHANLDLRLDIPATASVNTPGCSYLIPFTVSIAAK